MATSSVVTNAPATGTTLDHVGDRCRTQLPLSALRTAGVNGDLRLDPAMRGPSHDSDTAVAAYRRCVRGTSALPALRNRPSKNRWQIVTGLAQSSSWPPWIVSAGRYRQVLSRGTPGPVCGVLPLHCRGPLVTYVRPHYRRDGTYVKGHNRRTRPRTVQPHTASRRNTPRPVPVSRPRPITTGPTTHVRPYYRSDGTRVRGHRRSISPRTLAMAASTGGGGLLLLILLALAGGPGTGSEAPAGTTPSHSASVSATHSP